MRVRRPFFSAVVGGEHCDIARDFGSTAKGSVVIRWDNFFRSDSLSCERRLEHPTRQDRLGRKSECLLLASNKRRKDRFGLVLKIAHPSVVASRAEAAHPDVGRRRVKTARFFRL